MLPGFRFQPTDEELLGFYLRRKVDKIPLYFEELIRDVDIYKHDPWDLPKMGSSVGEKEWYFFCMRGRKYRNSLRPNRVTESGFWKATGIDKPIYSTGKIHEYCIIGLKKSLVFYKGSAGKGTKTDWMMHEFRLPPNQSIPSTADISSQPEVWTLCRIFKKIASYKRYKSDYCRNHLERKEKKKIAIMHMNNTDYFPATEQNMAAQTSYSSSNTTLWNQNNGDEFFKDDDEGNNGMNSLDQWLI